ncbi:cytochrome c oxidase subunit 2 [Natronospira proteinivora]|uniref:Cytochrome c oxidase subunit 2 n=1 Tax=Natronospira proteinivora TaxID=1807133 RepID=A0ABT1GC62_9GAMM|nr:cytochrome c oxidase subunit II [Natronospira proteinivora]MCP1727953.1 cytochrome c oxidase subunit 2 [Natronospira proteinivora]
MFTAKLSGAIRHIFLLGFLMLPGQALAFREGINLPRGVTTMSEDIYNLHMLIFWICVVIAVLVFGAMIISIFMHRKSRGVEPAKWHHNTAVEVVWTVIPFLILIGMAIPAAKSLIELEDYRDYDMSIQVTGYQWFWHYDYRGEDVSFYSRLDRDSNRARQLRPHRELNPMEVDNYLLEVDNRVVVPINQKVLILLTADDVIHAWWVPELGGKKDAIPGVVNEMWFEVTEPGVYRGQCAELCGRDHGFMPIVVEAVEEEEYEAWLEEQREEQTAEEDDESMQLSAIEVAR